MDGRLSGRSLVRRYYLYRATLSVGFITPVFTLFLLRSLTFTQVAMLSALYSVLSVAGEVPTGYLGDRLGRRASLLASVAFTVASLAGFVVARSFRWYALLYALWALGLTLRSGSLDAWLYDTLDERLDAGRFTRVRGRGDAVQRWASAVTMVAGGLLYGVAPTAPFVAAVAFNSLGVVALLSLPKNRQYVDDGTAGVAEDATADDAAEDETDDATGTETADGDGEAMADPGPREMFRVLRRRLLRPPLRSLVLYLGLFYATVGAANTYVQPVAIETLGPVAARLGVSMPPGGAVAAARSGAAGAPLALGLGVLYAALSALASVGGYHAGTLEDRLGTRRAMLVVPAVTAVALVVPAGVALLSLPVFVVLRTADPVVRPIANGYVSDHAGAAGKATLLSAVSMLTMAVRVPLVLGGGVVADATDATTAVAALGVAFLVAGTGVWLAEGFAPADDAATGAED